MSEKTANQILLNEKLTSLLNVDANITNFNIFAINLLDQNLKKIKWGDQFGVITPYWLFIKGGTALRLIFEANGQKDLMPQPSDWDTQIVINPEYDFDTWYLAFNKIEQAINDTLVMANMVFTLLPGLKTQLETTFTTECNNTELIVSEWNGDVSYRSSADRKTVYLYEVFHPLQPADVARRRFAHLTPQQWHDSEQDDSLFDELFPRETVEFNQLQYRALKFWKQSHTAFLEFIALTKWGLNQDAIDQIDQQYNFFRWSLERVTDLNKAEAISWLKTYFDETLEPDATAKQVMKSLREQYKAVPEQGILLGSGQRTLIIDEFYLYRLVVRYKYNKPAELAIGKSPEDYREAWTASGNLRGELIDVTIPRRDTYEARHHGVMLDTGVWLVHNIDIKISDNDTADPISLPVLSNAYQLSEQVLIVREILAGTSSSAQKIHKRLLRGFALGSNGKASDSGRKQARKSLIEVLNQQFVSTYQGFANTNVDDAIMQAKEKLDSWAENEDLKDFDLITLKRLFNDQIKQSTDSLKKTNLTGSKLKNLSTFVPDVNNLASYPNVWGEDQNNAGMLDFFMIATIYASVADRVQLMLSGHELDLSINKPRYATDARELIKAFARGLNDHPNIYPQVTGRAATYYHLKELDEVFDGISTNLKVSTIDIRAIYFYKPEIKKLPAKKFGLAVRKILLAIGNLLVDSKKIISFQIIHSHDSFVTLDVTYSIEKVLHTQTYLRVEFDFKSWEKLPEYQTEYAYGIPVIRLPDLISRLQYQIGASEYTQSQQVSFELKTLQQALSVREYSSHSTASKIPPPLKRRLSNAGLLNLQSQ